MRRVVEATAVRAVVLLLAFGVGGVAGAPSMAMPPRGVSITGATDDDDPDDGGGWERPPGPASPADAPRVNVASSETSTARDLVGAAR